MRGREEEALEYLKGWFNFGDRRNSSSTNNFGMNDSHFEKGEFILTYNRSLNYIGLTYDRLAALSMTLEKESKNE
jgi:hypothetical protein